MKLDVAIISVLFGTAAIIGCAPAQPAQSPGEQVSTTQLTSASADAPLPPAPRTPLLTWYTPETDALPRPAKRPLDTSNPWDSSEVAQPSQPAQPAQPAAPAEKAASPAVAPR